MLRDIIPHSDQKRDKASFLLEVHRFLEIVMVILSLSSFQNFEQWLFTLLIGYRVHSVFTGKSTQV